MTAVGTRTTLAGWGANLRAECLLTEPTATCDVAGVVDHAGGTIARGLGRSYGDCAINAERQVIGTTRMDRLLHFDEATGVLLCEGGASLEAVIDTFAGKGWFPMITPGTKFVTVAGCIANDIHGKAHHAQGTFSNCVYSMTVLLASGDVVTASREEHADLFWATFGGMGLLGVILTATIQLRRIETTYFVQKPVKARNLREMLDALEEHDAGFPYSVATLDVMASGTELGRGVLVVGDHAKLSDLPEKLREEPLLVSPPPKITIPMDLPEFSLNPLSIRVVNAVIQRIQAAATPIGHYEAFFYPLDKIAEWNRGYGRRGFTQYQFVIPFENGEAQMRKILTTILSSGQLPFLNVLKRMGKESGGLLSFPQEGYTFAIDFPVREGTKQLTQKLDAMVLDAGGRIYLGKDSYIDGATFRRMYPAVEDWLRVKRKYDPMGVFTSNLGRRVGLS